MTHVIAVAARNLRSVVGKRFKVTHSYVTLDSGIMV